MNDPEPEPAPTAVPEAELLPAPASMPASEPESVAETTPIAAQIQPAAETAPEYEALDPEAAARELEERFIEKRAAPLFSGVAIAGINLGLLAIAAIPVAMNYRLHEHGALPFVVLPFAISGFVCGWVARRKILGMAAMSLNVCAAVAVFYAPELIQM